MGNEGNWWWLCSSDVKCRKYIFWKIKEAYILVKDDLIVKKVLESLYAF